MTSLKHWSLSQFLSQSITVHNFLKLCCQRLEDILVVSIVWGLKDERFCLTSEPNALPQTLYEALENWHKPW